MKQGLAHCLIGHSFLMVALERPKFVFNILASRTSPPCVYNCYTISLLLESNMASLRNSTSTLSEGPAGSASAFFLLPAELRIAIYELVVAKPDDIRLNDEGKLHPHPLMRVCSQAWNEFSSIWKEAAFRNATNIKIYFGDNISTTSSSQLLKTICQLPTPAEDSNHQVIMHIYMTNTFDSHFHKLTPTLKDVWCALPMSTAQRRKNVFFAIDFDYRSFDVDYLRQWTGKYLLELRIDPFSGRRWDWLHANTSFDSHRRLAQAFEEAFARSDAAKVTGAVRKGKKRASASLEKTEQRKRKKLR